MRRAASALPTLHSDAPVDNVDLAFVAVSALGTIMVLGKSRDYKQFSHNKIKTKCLLQFKF